MIKLCLEKLYRYPRVMEHMSVAIPIAKGRLFDTGQCKVFDKQIELPVQTKVTARHEDGSIRYMFVRFAGTLPANAAYQFQLYLDDQDERENRKDVVGNIVRDESVEMVSFDDFKYIKVEQSNHTIAVDTGKIQFQVRDYTENIFDSITYLGKNFTKEQFYGPVLKDGLGDIYRVEIDDWNIVESGKLCTILKAKGCNVSGGEGCEEGKHIKFEVKITAYADKSWLDISYRIINSSDEKLQVASLVFGLLSVEQKKINSLLENELSVLELSNQKSNENNLSLLELAKTKNEMKLDSTGCGDLRGSACHNNVITTTGIKDLPKIESSISLKTIRTCAGSSNYKTNFDIGQNGQGVYKIASAENLVMESNEHISEVFYGTFFADRTADEVGVSATIYQAQQNYPKAVKADRAGVYVYLVPEKVDKVVMFPGTSREQQFQLFFHEPQESLLEIDNRSLIYQMPDRPVIAPSVYKESGVMQDVFADKLTEDVEIMLINKADNHARCFGMMNWGDAVDMNYTNQGRGGGELVWSNNEYDFPHACALMYARTGIRRFLDYTIVNARHWMDVDVCHYSLDPLRIGGQIEHTNNHVENGVMVPSHQWVEGLLDYYHFTGDERGLETALGIGENILKILDTPMYTTPGEANARETGWALRSLTALYIETNDAKWLDKCEWIVGFFEGWHEEFDSFIAQYTDNTLIRVGFMISVAVGSLMRYYRVAPSDRIKALILEAVEDVKDNCLMDCGLFYYKELPSLAKLSTNALLLEAMAIGYELTGDQSYLQAGKMTFLYTVRSGLQGIGGAKKIVGDTLIYPGDSTKTFAQSFYPLAVFYKYLVEAGIDQSEKDSLSNIY